MFKLVHFTVAVANIRSLKYYLHLTSVNISTTSLWNSKTEISDDPNYTNYGAFWQKAVHANYFWQIVSDILIEFSTSETIK